MVLNVLGTILSPVSAIFGSKYLMVMRILEGLGGGVTFPAMNVLIAAWAPLNERSVITSIIYGGKSKSAFPYLMSWTGKLLY